jgi:hypothetical protein
MTSFASGEEALAYVRSLSHDKKEQRHSWHYIFRPV